MRKIYILIVLGAVAMFMFGFDSAFRSRGRIVR